MDIQAERRNTAKERQRADKEKQLKIEAEERAEAAEKQVADERKQKEVLEAEVQRLRKLLETEVI